MFPRHGGEIHGKYIQDDPILLERAVSACKDGVCIPVTVKLNANCINVNEITEACRRGGADGIAATNTIASIVSVDLATWRPVPASNGYSTFGGYCGPALRPIALRFVAEIAKTTDLPISGMGGVQDWKNAVEFLLLGASTVQVATEVMLQGYGIVSGLMQNLNGYLESMACAGIDEIKGKSLEYLVSSEEIDALIPARVALVDEHKCTLCGLCVEPCRVGATNAISMTNEHLFINEATCIGCGLCIIVCPFDALQVH